MNCDFSIRQIDRQIDRQILSFYINPFKNFYSQNDKRLKLFENKYKNYKNIPVYLNTFFHLIYIYIYIYDHDIDTYQKQFDI